MNEIRTTFVVSNCLKEYAENSVCPKPCEIFLINKTLDWNIYKQGSG